MIKELDLLEVKVEYEYLKSMGYCPAELWLELLKKIQNLKI
jgi:hypothetical protein